MPKISVEIAGNQYRANSESVYDISIPLDFNAPQLQAYGAPAAKATTYLQNSFLGDVKQGGSCNCQSYQVIPHCHGTHTESVGHITQSGVAVNTLATQGLMLAELITIQPTQISNNDGTDDFLITAQHLQQTFQKHSLKGLAALIIRTLPNDNSKLTQNYDVLPYPAYFEPAALAWLASIGIEHVLVDVPSVDRIADGGKLLAHRAFWGLPAGNTNVAHAVRPQATITELIYVPAHVQDGTYLLSLQIAPWCTDAAPSRPLLYPLLTQ
jgi:hypothetical protein